MTGTAPANTTAFKVSGQVTAGTITSSPGPMPVPSMARCSAAVPLEVATACLTPHASAQARSNRPTQCPGLRYRSATTWPRFSITFGDISGSVAR